MLEYMENVSQSEAENIRKTIQDLFRQTCILQTKCDPVTLIQKDNPQISLRWTGKEPVHHRKLHGQYQRSDA